MNLCPIRPCFHLLQVRTRQAVNKENIRAIWRKVHGTRTEDYRRDVVYIINDREVETELEDNFD